MQCLRCGNDLQIGDLFCGQCGLPVRAATGRHEIYPAYMSPSQDGSVLPHTEDAIGPYQQGGGGVQKTGSTPSISSTPSGGVPSRQTRPVPVPPRVSGIFPYPGMTGALPKQTRLVPVYAPPTSNPSYPSLPSFSPIPSYELLKHSSTPSIPAVPATAPYSPAHVTKDTRSFRSVSPVENMQPRSSLTDTYQRSPQAQNSSSRYQQSQKMASVIPASYPSSVTASLPSHPPVNPFPVASATSSQTGRTPQKTQGSGVGKSSQRSSSLLSSLPVVACIVLVLLILGIIGGSLFFASRQSQGRPMHSTNDIGNPLTCIEMTLSTSASIDAPFSSSIRL